MVLPIKTPLEIRGLSRLILTLILNFHWQKNFWNIELVKTLTSQAAKTLQHHVALALVILNWWVRIELKHWGINTSTENQRSQSQLYCPLYLKMLSCEFSFCSWAKQASFCLLDKWFIFLVHMKKNRFVNRGDLGFQSKPFFFLQPQIKEKSTQAIKKLTC